MLKQCSQQLPGLGKGGGHAPRGRSLSVSELAADLQQAL